MSAGFTMDRLLRWLDGALFRLQVRISSYRHRRILRRLPQDRERDPIQFDPMRFNRKD